MGEESLLREAEFQERKASLLIALLNVKPVEQQEMKEITRWGVRALQ